MALFRAKIGPKSGHYPRLGVTLAHFWPFLGPKIDQNLRLDLQKLTKQSPNPPCSYCTCLTSPTQVPPIVLTSLARSFYDRDGNLADFFAKAKKSILRTKCYFCQKVALFAKLGAKLGGKSSFLGKLGLDFCPKILGFLILAI